LLLHLKKNHLNQWQHDTCSSYAREQFNLSCILFNFKFSVTITQTQTLLCTTWKIKFAWRTKSWNLLEIYDSSNLWAQFEDLNDVKWRKFEYQSCRSIRAIQFRVWVWLIWTSDEEVMVEILKTEEYGRVQFGKESFISKQGRT
jgi:hypothetical protein